MTFITKKEAREIAEDVCKEKFEPIKNLVIMLLEKDGLNVWEEDNGEIKFRRDW